MKYSLKGFIKIPTLANNANGECSALGELTDESYSYARDKGFYQQADKPNVELISFTSKNLPATKVPVPAVYSTHVLEVSQWIFEQATAGLTSSDEEAFRRMLLAQFVDIEDLEVGKMEVARGSWLPTYMRWKLSSADGEDNTIRIWYANAAFEAQYDDYEIIVVPPITPVDTFQKVRKEVEAALAKFNLPDHHKHVLERTENDPYTFLVTKIYNWVDREEPTFMLPTNWSVAIYGIAGNNPALIKQAIADWILANSAYTKPDWIPVFPDIFTSTEFTFVPMWHLLSSEEETPRGSLYSPNIPYNGMLELATKYIDYPVAGHVAKYLSSFGLPFKSLALLACGGNENRLDKFTFGEVFPRYANLSTQSVDFNRMDKRTVLFVQKLVEATIAAEEMDEYSYIGASLARIKRNNRLYVAFEYENFLYLVLGRKYMDEAASSVHEDVTK